MTVDSFKAARKENCESGLIFGNTDHFGETATFTPGGGGASRSIDVVICRAEAEQIDGEVVEYDQELIWVDACKDPGCDRGGIDQPVTGDCLLRTGDPPSNPWTFQKQVRGETEHSWMLLYGRNRPARYGRPERL